MSTEFILNKELANIGMTLTEFSRIARIINAEISRGDFSDLFNTMMGRMARSYDVVIDTLQPLTGIDSENAFQADYDTCVDSYKANYLMAISKARALTVDAYDDYEHLKCMREAKTRFPLLKRTFTRLETLADKWIANDYWLAMSIDTLFKMLPRLLQEISELKPRDPEDAYLIYSAALSDMAVHLAVIRQQNEGLHAIIRSPEPEMQAGCVME